MCPYKRRMTKHTALYAPVHESPSKLCLVAAALLALLPLALYIAIKYFDAPMFDTAWVGGIMPGWPLALFLLIQGLPNSGEARPHQAFAHA